MRTEFLSGGMGLSRGDVERSRKQYGSNQLTQKKRRGFFRQFLASFGDPIIKTLLAALAVNLLFLFRNEGWFETAGIALAVFLATFVSTLSEYGSESAFLKLQEEAENILCRIRRREGAKALPIGEIVVGDLVLLQAGERIPADGLLISGSLKVDQSALNGESVEVTKTPGDVNTREWDLAASNQLFRGTVVTGGEGVLSVCNVGDNTFYGRIAGELQEQSRESPLKLKLGDLAHKISRLGYAGGILIALSDLFHRLVLENGFQLPLILAELKNLPEMLANLLHALTLAITVIVVAVPEGLPMMITVVLSSNMFRMLKDQVMVRKLVGIETAGSIDLLFTDKTGTLTKGRLTATKVVTGDGRQYPESTLKSSPPLWELLSLSGLYNSQSTMGAEGPLGGNATDRALLEFVLPVSPEVNRYKKERSVPFDSSLKYSMAVVSGSSGVLTLVKGAPEKLLPHCTGYYGTKGEIRQDFRRELLLRKCREMTNQSMRVLALAAAPVRHKGDSLPENLAFIGLVGIRDDLRPQVPGAVAKAQQAGIQVVMITGDNQDTAAAIAREAGILQSENDRVLTSTQLAALDDRAVKDLLPRLRVVARALPSDKSRLVRLAQEEGHVVGMTGDGVNDAPALKRADVGFAMGDGAEVAREAGDIVILDNNFASITKAVLYGRTIFKSIRKFVVFQLTMNLCAVGVSLIGPFIGVDTPVTVIQMLWINIIMDTLSGLAFAGEPPLPEYMAELPKKRTEPVLSRDMVNQILVTGVYTVLLCVFFLKSSWVSGLFRPHPPGLYQMTAFFALFVFSGIFNSLNARTHRLNLSAHLGRNRSFLGIMLAVAAVQLALIYWGGALFRTAGLTPRELLLTLLFAATVIPADLLRKITLRLRHRNQGF